MAEKYNSKDTIHTAEMIQIVLPNDTNTLGNLLGGKLMHWIDLTASIAGRRYCGKTVVTASMDKLDFLNPVKLGEIVVLRASVNRTFNTSMEIGVKVYTENPYEKTMRHTASAYLTFVALGDDGKPAKLAPFQPESAEEKQRYEDAGIRRESRVGKR